METPFTSRRRRCTSSRSLRSKNSTPEGKISRLLHLPTSSLTTTMVSTPSARIMCAICGTDSVPSTGWPPVIATASL